MICSCPLTSHTDYIRTVSAFAVPQYVYVNTLENIGSAMQLLTKFHINVRTFGQLRYPAEKTAFMLSNSRAFSGNKLNFRQMFLILSGLRSERTASRGQTEFQLYH